MFIVARPNNFPFDEKLEPARTALLVIDMQIDFLSQDGYFARQGYDPAPLRKTIKPINRVIQAARNAGIKIIFTRQGYRADLADMGEHDRWRRRRNGLEGTTALLRGNPGFEIVPEMDVGPSDIIIDKTANGAFTDTDLDRVLRAQGIRNLMFSGVTTDVCVHTTLREATDRNYVNLLIEDCCSSGDAFAHEAAIHMTTVENGVFGVVTPSDQVIQGLNQI
jgi:nicotinamidase-related amidase